MTALTLDPEQVASERQVILEEIAMYDSEPWDALEMAVQDRPLRRPPLRPPGARHPRGAAGDRRRGPARLPPPLLPARQRHPGGGRRHRRRRSGRRRASARRHPRRRASRAAASTRPPLSPPALERLERRKGEVARLLLALPGPARRAPRPSGPAPGGHRARRRPHQPPPAHPGRGGAGLRLGVRRSLRGDGRQHDDRRRRGGAGRRSRPGGGAGLRAAGRAARQPARRRGGRALPADRPSPTGCSATRRSTSRRSPWGWRSPSSTSSTSTFTSSACSPPIPDRMLAAADRYIRPERGAVVGWSLPKS